jgi:hypothetical protein
VRKHLPEYLKAVMTVGYYTGWRVASELLTRERKHVVNGMLILEAGEGKNEEPRRFPLDVIPELRETIERQIESTRKLEIETGRVIPRLFHNKGRKIVDYTPAWHKACAGAKVRGAFLTIFAVPQPEIWSTLASTRFSQCSWLAGKIPRCSNATVSSTTRRSSVAQPSSVLTSQSRRQSLRRWSRSMLSRASGKVRAKFAHDRSLNCMSMDEIAATLLTF